MKQQRVRLMKQLKAESEHFRRTKAVMAREMLQLKSQVSIAQQHSLCRDVCLFSFDCLSVFLMLRLLKKLYILQSNKG